MHFAAAKTSGIFNMIMKSFLQQSAQETTVRWKTTLMKYSLGFFLQKLIYNYFTYNSFI